MRGWCMLHSISLLDIQGKVGEGSWMSGLTLRAEVRWVVAIWESAACRQYSEPQGHMNHPGYECGQ